VRAKPLFRSFHGFEFGFGMRLREMISRANRFCRSQSCMACRRAHRLPLLPCDLFDIEKSNDA
jgi:hypothetical protein